MASSFGAKERYGGGGWIPSFAATNVWPNKKRQLSLKKGMSFFFFFCSFFLGNAKIMNRTYILYHQ